MAKKTDWSKEIQPLLKKYKRTPHPLEYNNVYQLLVMVVLSAQDADRNINRLAPEFFEAYPDMASLANASPDDLIPYLSKVRNFRNKVEWLVKTARQIRTDKKIPFSMEELTALPGIGRKSANVIRRGAGVKPQGVIVDLHVVRVAPRIGIASGTHPLKIERQIMEALPQKDWDAGMAMSFLGRETCRPSNPRHDECVMKEVCAFYKASKKRGQPSRS